MRIAILSDIHGNIIALEAVLAEIAGGTAVDEYWILGDIVALGPTPIEVLERLTALPNIRFIRGNTDRYIYTGDRPPPTLEEALTSLRKVQVLSEVAGSFAWTQGAISQAGWFDWLSQLPFEIRMDLPDGTRVLAVHVAPGKEDGLGLLARLNEDELWQLVADCEADLIFGGHHHQPLDVHVKGKHIVNVGSLSNPVPPDLRASYVVLTADPSGYQIEHHRVDYDREAVVEQMENLRHPGRNYVIAHLRGRRK
jgi:predicted phosphodiesterase